MNERAVIPFPPQARRVPASLARRGIAGVRDNLGPDKEVRLCDLYMRIFRDEVAAHFPGLGKE